MSRWRALVGLIALFLIQILIIYPSIRVNQLSLEVDHGIFGLTTNLSQTDPLILNRIKQNHIFPPSMKERDLKKAVDRLTSKAVPELISALNAKKPGFFIECSANDGEFDSDTLDLEVNYNWTGLLIEGSPTLFNKLKAKNRNAWLANVCLSGLWPEKVEFLTHKEVKPSWRAGKGNIDLGRKFQKPTAIGTEKIKREDYISEGLVECFPLHSVLASINVTSVNYFDLDVGGHEYKILQSIPFDKIRIDVIVVEHRLAPEGKTAIKKLLEKHGYRLLKETKSDYVFKKKSK